MYKLNILQYNYKNILNNDKDFSLSILKNNDNYLELKNEFVKKYKKESLYTFSFSKAGFLDLLLQLNKKGKIAVSLGETQALIDAALEFESLGFKVFWLGLSKNGEVDFYEIENLQLDFIFLSSYVMDTFVKIDIKQIKDLSKAKIISNASANFDENSDMIYFDSYKLTGYFLSGIILFNGEVFCEQVIAFIDTIAVLNVYKSLKKQNFENSQKEIFKNKLIQVFKEDLYFFVDNANTLAHSLHFALKDIKARELIRTLALDGIYITNGEGCSLGLSKPSRIIQAMGYAEDVSRNSISLSFHKKYEEKQIDEIVKMIQIKYKQIKTLNQGK